MLQVIRDDLVEINRVRGGSPDLPSTEVTYPSSCLAGQTYLEIELSIELV